MPATLAVLGILGSVAGVVVVFGRGLRSRGGPPVVVVGSWWVILRKRLNEGNVKKCKILHTFLLYVLQANPPFY